MLEEHIILKEKDVLISNVRFVIDEEETYAMSGIVSVKLERGGRKVNQLKMSFGLLFVVAGLLYVVNDGVMGLIGFIAGLILSVNAIEKIPHGIEFKTSGGDSEFYTNDDDRFMEKVFKALNDVIIFRG